MNGSIHVYIGSQYTYAIVYICGFLGRGSEKGNVRRLVPDQFQTNFNTKGNCVTNSTVLKGLKQQPFFTQKKTFFSVSKVIKMF